MSANFWMGFVLFFVAILSLGGYYGHYLVQRDGTLVKMRISAIKPARSRYGKSVYEVVFSYNGEEFSHKAGASFCIEHHVGDLVEMRYAEGIHLALFPAEDTETIFQILELRHVLDWD